MAACLALGTFATRELTVLSGSSPCSQTRGSTATASSRYPASPNLPAHCTKDPKLETYTAVSCSCKLRVKSSSDRPSFALQGTVSMLRNNFGVGSSLGIFGHSAGGGTSTSVGSQDFPLGRVAIAGFRGYGGADPLLVIASRGDGIIPLDGIITALPLGSTLAFPPHGLPKCLC